MLRAIETHLASRQVSRVIYGAIIGIALLVALDDHPPTTAIVIASLLTTALAVALAELYSDLVGTQARVRRHLERSELRHITEDVVAVAIGIAFPVVFFLLAAAHAIDEHTAFKTAEWTGVGLLVFYGFAASRLAGENVTASVLRALGAGLIGLLLIGLKAVLH